MGGQTDRNMVLDNLELVSGSVLLKDEDENGEAMNGAAESQTGGLNMNGGGLNIGMPGRGAGDITLAQAFRQIRTQMMTGLSNPDTGM